VPPLQPPSAPSFSRQSRPRPRRPFPASHPRPRRPSLQSRPRQRRVLVAHLSHLFLSLALLTRRRSVGCRLSCLLARPLFMAMVDEGGKGEAQPLGLDPRTRRSAATRATGDMDGGGRGEEWEAPPATCSRSRRRRCPCPSSSPAWTPPSSARGAAISATVAIRRAGGPSGSPSPRRRRQKGRFPHRRRPIIRPRRVVPVLGGGLCGGSKWFPPGSRSPPRRDPRCSPRKDGDLLYPTIHSPHRAAFRAGAAASPPPPPHSAPPYPAYASPPSHPQPLLHRAALKTSTASDFPRSTPPPGCFPSGVAISSTARSTLLSKEG
jgi:hypothetical protein